MEQNEYISFTWSVVLSLVSVPHYSNRPKIRPKLCTWLSVLDCWCPVGSTPQINCSRKGQSGNPRRKHLSPLGPSRRSPSTTYSSHKTTPNTFHPLTPCHVSSRGFPKPSAATITWTLKTQQHYYTLTNKEQSNIPNCHK